MGKNRDNSALVGEEFCWLERLGLLQFGLVRSDLF